MFQKWITLYKGILKNYSIKLADTMNTYEDSKEWVYTKIFYTLEEYIQNILSLKIRIGNDIVAKDVKKEYENYETYTVGKLDTKDNIEKNVLLLSISRKLFTHSLPLIVAIQCYEKVLKDARILVQRHKDSYKERKSIWYVNQSI